MYVLIDNIHGCIFGAVEARDPVDAAFLVDEECGFEVEEHREVDAIESASAASLYYVYELNDPSTLPCPVSEIADEAHGTDIIEWVEKLPLVARVAREFE